MIVAGLQTDIAWEDPSANFERVEVLAARAAAQGARLLVLPEMFATGFSMAAPRISAHADETRVFLAELARRHAAWTLGGFAEPGEPRPHNACALFDPAGTEVLHYQKVHPFSLAGEHTHYSGGSSLPSAVADDIRLTAVICYDLRFPELFRAAAAWTDLFLVIANWPEPRRGHWSTLLQARAIENQAFVLGVNRVGRGDGLEYAGDSALVSPLGEVLASAARQPGIVLGSVSSADVAAARSSFSFLADRRPALYAALASAEGGTDPTG
jgi:predicted amidohydrolase